MKARKCFMCRLLARAYEMAKKRGEKCVLCAFVTFLLSMPISACADSMEDAECPAIAIVSNRIVIQLPNTPLCWLFKKLTGMEPPTPRAFAIAFANNAAHVAGSSLYFE